MDIKDTLNVLENSKKQLEQLLNDCKDGPAELTLLAYKMMPMLEDFSRAEAELFSAASTSPLPMEPSTEENTSSHE